MVDGAWERDDAPDGARRERLVPWARSAPRWPVSAVCAVAVLAVLVLVLLVMNVLGLQLGRGGRYDPQAGGSVAEWFGAIATLVALPAAVLFGVRQLQSTGEAIQLGQRQLEADQQERAERRLAELAALRQALRVSVDVANVADAAELATGSERAAVERWRQEYAQRGWVPDATAATWEQGSVRRSTAELLSAEPSPLVPEPWFVALSCRNMGTATLVVQRWTVLLDGTATTVEARHELAPGDTLHRRLGSDVGLPTAYTSRDDAGAVVERLAVVVDGSDTASRPVRIVHPPVE
jgi:hypothetical protein